ncbi:MAG TPA: type II secretion system F family protein [Clostridiales bacterium]|nr:type II secretion system F family protein [Clostridiales bacterium]
MSLAILAYLTAILVLYILSKGKYDNLVESLDKKQFPLKNLLPIGLYIMDAIGCRYVSNYDRRLLVKISEIYGSKNSWHYLKIHWANKMVLFALGVFVILLIGLGTAIDMTYAVLSICFLAMIVILSDRELDSKLKRRHLSIQWDFPDFLNKLTLLVNAGLTTSRAWEKVIRENKKQSDLYREAEIVIAEINSGKSEIKAYEDFSRRCRTVEVARFVSIVIQNIRKGNSELASIFRVLSNECWEMRKNTAKKLGEEASTKMVIPMMFMLVAILLIVSTPAVLSIFKM